MRVTVLGCGGSAGVPEIGNVWGHCDPANPKNRRRRSSVLVAEGDALILVDTPPDLREQLIDASVRRLDAVLWTHAHADHTHGLIDLREICRLIARPLDVYGDAETLDQLRASFGYCFMPPPPEEEGPYRRPVLVPHVVERPFAVAGVTVVPFEQDHGRSRSLGFRLGRFGYSTDVVRLDEAAFRALEGVDVWVVDCAREEPHAVHAHLDLALSWIERLKPRRAVLTHLGHSLDYETLRRKLPPGVEPAYDGMVLDVLP